MVVKKKWTATEVRSLLNERFCQSNGYVYVNEVPNATTVHKSRTIDGLAMGIWKKSGITLNAFEIKVARTDFLRELDDISKAADFESQAHYFWLVSPRDVAKVEEIPANWGWLVVSESGLTIRKRAVLNASANLTYHFLAALLRVMDNRPRPGAVELTAEFNRGFETGRNLRAHSEAATAKRNTVDLERRIDRANQIAREFKDVCGVDITDYYQSGHRLGQAVKVVMAQPNLNAIQDQMTRAMSVINSAAHSLTAGLRAFESINPTDSNS